MIYRRSMLIVTAVIPVVIIGYLFLWGSLFPFSPVIIGFDRYESDRAIIWVQHGAVFKEFSLVDSILPSVEAFHSLTFKRKPVVFIFRDQASFDRRSVSQARFCAFPNGTLVVAPRALDEAHEGVISLKIYLTHELSHVLLYQHMSLRRAFSYPRWLLEGIAMSGAEQMGTSWYPDRSETYAIIARGNFMPPKDYATHREDDVVFDVPDRIAFIYSEFGCLVEYLIQTYGRDAFLGYMTELCVDTNHDKVFTDAFDVSFDQALEDFREYAAKAVADSE